MKKKGSISTIVTVVVVLLVAAFAFRQYYKYRMTPTIHINELHFKDLNGNPVDLATAYKGKTLFVNFYATWCPPCNREMPELNKLKQALADQNIAFLAVTGEPPHLIRGFMRRTGSEFTFLQSVETEASYGINTIPTTYVFGPDGKELYSEIGAKNWASPEMIDYIRGLVK